VSSSTPVTAKRRLDLLDVYRGIAILLVVIYHYTYRYPISLMGYSEQPAGITFGHFGVKLFFAISGFCIAMTAASTRSASQFLARRVSRIYPTFFFATILTFVILTFFPAPGMTVDTKDLVGNWFFLGNLGFRWVDGAYWSMAVELRFYLLFAVFYYRPNWILPGLAAIATVAVASAGYLLIVGEFSLESWLVLLPVRLLDSLLILQRVPWFLLGICFYWFYTQGRSWRTDVGFVVSFAWLLVVAYYFQDPGRPIAFALVAAAMSLAVVCPDLRVPRWMAYLGTISYPLYLVHQNIGVSLIRRVAGLNDYLQIAVGLYASIVLTLALHYGVEFRFRRKVDAFILRGLKLAAAVFSRMRIIVLRPPAYAIVEVQDGPTADTPASRSRLS
jgi:peptidoglycan/LPS O-acetylase OafA/YrhL